MHVLSCNGEVGSQLDPATTSAVPGHPSGALDLVEEVCDPGDDGGN